MGIGEIHMRFALLVMLFASSLFADGVVKAVGDAAKFAAKMALSKAPKDSEGGSLGGALESLAEQARLGVITPQQATEIGDAILLEERAQSGIPQPEVAPRSAVAFRASDEPEPIIEGGSHGGSIARENISYEDIEPVRSAPKKFAKPQLERVELPVLSSIDTARQAIEEEVKKGNIPESAVGPLLAKIAPMVQQFENRLTDAGDDEKKIRDLLKEAPRFQLDYERGASSTQVIAQIVNGMKDAGTESTASAPAPATSGSTAAPIAYNQPAPAVVVVPQAATTSGSSAPMLMTVTKKPAGEMAWNPKVGEEMKLPGSRRAVAEVSAGTVSTQGFSKSFAGAGTGMGSGNNSGTISFAGKVSKSKEVLKDWVRGLVSRMKEEPLLEDRSPASEGEILASGGFSVLKPPRLSASAAILKFPEAAWDSTAVTMKDLADTWELPEWARLLVLLSGSTFITLTAWLVWRRRFVPRD